MRVLAHSSHLAGLMLDLHLEVKMMACVCMSSLPTEIAFHVLEVSIIYAIYYLLMLFLVGGETKSV